MSGTTKRWQLRADLHNVDLREVGAIDSAIRVSIPGQPSPVWIPRAALTEVIPPFQVGRAYVRADVPAALTQYRYQVAAQADDLFLCWVFKGNRIISSATLRAAERDKFHEV